MMRFTKMHGTGNDYIFIDAIEQVPGDISGLARRLSDRHFGVGSDGLVLIRESKQADCFMDMYNSDGSRSEMCGNAIRCVGKYVYDRGIVTKTVIRVETLAGIKVLQMQVKDGAATGARVNMGEPVLKPGLIPVLHGGERAVAVDINVDGETFKATCVSMGNPHAVIFVDEITDRLVSEAGSRIEVHPLFPNKTNVEFVEVLGESTLRMRVWERGAGETLACGTGACASLVAAVLNGRCGRSATLRLLGGELQIEWAETDNCVYMTGEAVEVFSGEIAI